MSFTIFIAFIILILMKFKIVNLESISGVLILITLATILDGITIKYKKKWEFFKQINRSQIIDEEDKYTIYNMMPKYIFKCSIIQMLILSISFYFEHYVKEVFINGVYQNRIVCCICIFIWFILLVIPMLSTNRILKRKYKKLDISL
ncbi:hypothetical protein SAMN02745163_01751 [Clostridium cavendishii DSM 21758]|uniref:Uncharacterized protein n=1 Tax=Clostridium cavendishii DSM 21758 TaxID=1121302 RepID=A0A1M6IAL3_9CLOT|nr:hypothetical protein [Clostridium cavendishii]SHJ31500.1 hypothetical protein SAMN02745163_01751 [Clostridium cavendishii DSM 21758]